MRKVKMAKKRNKKNQKSFCPSPIIQKPIDEFNNEWENLIPGTTLKSFSDTVKNWTFILTIFNSLVLMANLVISLRLHSVAEKFLN